MKHKALLAGKNNSVISDFFAQLDDDFEILTTSDRYGDILGHIKYFKPDVFVFCIANETRDNMVRMVNIKQKLSDFAIPFVLVGSEEDCEEFGRVAINVANLTLVKPMSAHVMQKKICDFLGIWQPTTKKAAEQQEKFMFPEEPSLMQRTSVGDALLARMEDSSLEELILKPAKTQRKHILVVDDAPMMLKTIKEQLHHEYDIATAVNGGIAMKFLEKKKTDLILLDFEMPGENGPAVLEKLRANEATKEIPVVFLTGVSDREKIQEALAMKPQGYLLKPIDRERLMDVIRKLIG
ncbi:MAG: response regulator [Lachnospiraceae bacterium]|nr:response regulator [Lachnospiraceae bacterium]